MGNVWVLDPDYEHASGGRVFFVCHDPPVAMICGETLEDFLANTIRASSGRRNELVHIGRLVQLMDETASLDQQAAFHRDDRQMSEFASGLTPHYLIYDLRSGQVRAGFPWQSHRLRKTRHKNSRIFAIEKAMK